MIKLNSTLTYFRKLILVKIIFFNSTAADQCWPKSHIKMSYQNVISKSHIKMLYKNVIPKCHTKMSYQNIILKYYIITQVKEQNAKERARRC